MSSVPDKQSISFSTMDEKHYFRLGIKKPSKVVTIDHFANIVDSLSVYTESLPKYFAESGPLHTEMILRIFSVIIQQKEASARMTIDQFILLLAGFIKYDANGATSVFMLPELHIASTYQSEQEPDVTITWKGLETILTGSLDYALFSYSKNLLSFNTSRIPNSKLDAVLKASTRNMGDLKEAGRTLSVREQIIAGRMQICLVEAKSRSVKGGLESYIPQVVAESIASMHIIEEVEMMCWCITTGTEWIFGLTVLLDEADSIEKNAKYEYFTLEPMIIRDGRNITKYIDEDCLQILRVLTFWAKEEVDYIYRRIFA